MKPLSKNGCLWAYKIALEGLRRSNPKEPLLEIRAWFAVAQTQIVLFGRWAKVPYADRSQFCGDRWLTFCGPLLVAHLRCADWSLAFRENSLGFFLPKKKSEAAVSAVDVCTLRIDEGSCSFVSGDDAGGFAGAFHRFSHWSWRFLRIRLKSESEIFPAINGTFMADSTHRG